MKRVVSRAVHHTTSFNGGQRTRGLPRRTASYSGSRSLSPLRRTTRSNARQHQQAIETTKASVFCSDLYTTHFVLASIQKIALDQNIEQLEIEDLISRNVEELNQNIQKFLVQTTLCQSTKAIVLDEPTTTTTTGARDRRIAIQSFGKRKLTVDQAPKLRVWKEIVFVDSISDAGSYEDYLVQKDEFYKTLRSFLKKHGLDQTLPIRFMANVEIHSLLDPQQILDLLRVVQGDETVTRVKYLGALRYAKDIPADFKELLDPESLTVREKVDIYVHFDHQAMNLADNILQKKEGTANGSSPEAPEKDTTDRLNVLEDVQKCANIIEVMLFPERKMEEEKNNAPKDEQNVESTTQQVSPTNGRRGRSPPQSPTEKTPCSAPLPPVRQTSDSPTSRKKPKSKLQDMPPASPSSSIEESTIPMPPPLRASVSASSPKKSSPNKLRRRVQRSVTEPVKASPTNGRRRGPCTVMKPIDEHFWDEGLASGSTMAMKDTEEEATTQSTTHPSLEKEATSIQLQRHPHSRSPRVGRLAVSRTSSDKDDNRDKCGTMSTSSANTDGNEKRRAPRTRRKITRSQTNDSLGRVTISGSTRRVPARRTVSFNKHGAPDFKWQNHRVPAAEETKKTEMNTSSGNGKAHDSSTTTCEPSIRWDKQAGACPPSIPKRSRSPSSKERPAFDWESNHALKAESACS